MMQFTPVTYSPITYTESGDIFKPGANGIGFLNTGNDVVTVQGVILQPGAGWEPPNQFPGMLDDTPWVCSFEGVGDNPRLTVTRQYVSR